MWLVIVWYGFVSICVVSVDGCVRNVSFLFICVLLWCVMFCYGFCYSLLIVYRFSMCLLCLVIICYVLVIFSCVFLWCCYVLLCVSLLFQTQNMCLLIFYYAFLFRYVFLCFPMISVLALWGAPRVHVTHPSMSCAAPHTLARSMLQRQRSLLPRGMA